jgi:hypothetical protein
MTGMYERYILALIIVILDSLKDTSSTLQISIVGGGRLICLRNITNENKNKSNAWLILLAAFRRTPRDVLRWTNIYCWSSWWCSFFSVVQLLVTFSRSRRGWFSMKVPHCYVTVCCKWGFGRCIIWGTKEGDTCRGIETRRMKLWGGWKALRASSQTRAAGTATFVSLDHPP